MIGLRTLTALAIAATIGQFACSTSLPVAGPMDADRAGISVDVLQRGRDAYVAKCSGCHALFAPGAHDDATWAAQVNEMTEEANLSRDVADDILAYLQTLNGR